MLLANGENEKNIYLKKPNVDASMDATAAENWKGEYHESKCCTGSCEGTK